MPRRTEFQIAAEALVEAIEGYCSSGRGRHRMRLPLLRELVWYLVLNEDAQALKRLRGDWRRFDAACNRETRGSTRRRQIPAHAYLIATKKVSDSRAVRELADVMTVAEIDLLRWLVRKAQLHFADLAIRLPDSVRAQMEAHFEELVVQLDVHVLEDLLLAALESFAVPKGRRKFTEVYGLCFGTVRERNGDTKGIAKRVVQVSKVATQLRAHATHESVTPNDESAKVHLHVAEEVFEHLELVGDYHSHPWRTVEACERNHGWTLSDADRSQMRRWVRDQDREGRHPRFALVLAVAKAKRKGRSYVRRARNRLHVSVGHHSVHVAAYRLWMSGDADDRVVLRVPMLGV